MGVYFYFKNCRSIKSVRLSNFKKYQGLLEKELVVILWPPGNCLATTDSSPNLNLNYEWKHNCREGFFSA